MRRREFDDMPTSIDISRSWPSTIVVRVSSLHDGSCVRKWSLRAFIIVTREVSPNVRSVDANDSPTFSVIVPVYNRVSLVARTLDSVLSQAGSDIELIAVDDGSTDGSVELLASYGSRIKLLTQANRGPGAARNLGAKQARGEYLAFLDSDDLWFPWAARTYATVIERARHPAFVAGTPHVFRDEAELSGAREDELRYFSFPDFFASCDEWHWFSASSFIVKRSTFLEAGGFPEDAATEDVDLTLRLGLAPGFVHVTSPATFAYREHATSLKSNLLSYLVRGQQRVITEENEGMYPGGRERQRERRVIISRHGRPVTLGCIKAGRTREGWALYVSLLPWHLSLRRWKYLLGFPARLVVAEVRRRLHA